MLGFLIMFIIIIIGFFRVFNFIFDLYDFTKNN